MSIFALRKQLRAAIATLSIGFATTAFAAEITHDLGVTEVPDAPERIVALEFSFVDSLAAVGIAPIGIADDNNRTRVEFYADVIGDEWVSVGTRKTPSLEVIASLSPDLIIADKRRHEGVFEALSEIAPTVIFDSLSGTYETAVEVAATIGHAVGKDAEMSARIAEHKANMDAFKAELGDVSDLSLQFLIDTADGTWLHSPSSYNGSMLSWFGFKNNMPASDGGTYEEAVVGTSLEQLAEVNPQIILRGKYADPSNTDGFVGQPLFDNIEAVASGNLFDVDAHNWGRLRGILAAEVSAANLVEIMGTVEK